MARGELSRYHSPFDVSGNSPDQQVGPPLEWFAGLGTPTRGIISVNPSQAFFDLGDRERMMHHWKEWSHRRSNPSADPQAQETMAEAEAYIKGVTGFTPEQIQNAAVELRQNYLGKCAAPFALELVEIAPPRNPFEASNYLDDPTDLGSRILFQMLGDLDNRLEGASILNRLTEARRLLDLEMVHSPVSGLFRNVLQVYTAEIIGVDFFDQLQGQPLPLGYKSRIIGEITTVALWEQLSQEGPYDAILGIEVLPYVANELAQNTDRLKRILNPNGICILFSRHEQTEEVQEVFEVVEDGTNYFDRTAIVFRN
jgi:hypothetical protein